MEEWKKRERRCEGVRFVLLGQGNVFWLVLVFILFNFHFTRSFGIQGSIAFVIEHIATVILNGMLTT
jgi:hypothetical protein